MVSERWVCTNCGRERTSGDAVPALRPGLHPKFTTGKCAGEKGNPLRVFKQVVPEAKDLPEGERRKTNGIAHTATPGNAVWRARAKDIIAGLALQRIEFTSEDVTERVGMPPGSSNSAVGSLMNAAAKRGTIRWTGRMAKAERPNQHAALLKVWRGA